MSLEEFQTRVGHRFAQPELLRQAVTHASFGHEKRQRLPDNQRLEFLGDAVLQLIVTDELYRRFPELPEGRLTVQRAAIVNRNYLQALARGVGTGRGAHPRPRRGKQPGPRARLHFGRRDGGGDRRHLRRRRLGTDARAGAAAARTGAGRHDPRCNAPHATNPKGSLQEKLQAEGEDPPLYRCVAETGPPHARVYEVVVEWQARELGRGQGASKKEAETRAAEAALAAL